MKHTRLTTAVALLCASPFFAFGLGLAAKGIGNIRQSAQSIHWPKAEAKVSTSQVSATSTRMPDRSSSTSYSANIGFQYRVDGTTYSTSTRHFGQTLGSTDSSDAELLRLRYPDGANAWIYYDPSNPGVAVAEPGFHANLIWLPFVGLFFIVTAVMFLLLFLGRNSPGIFGAGIAIFGSVFVSLGLLGLAYGGEQIIHARHSTTWPRTNGQIVYQKIDSADSTPTTQETKTITTSYGPHLIYQYQVDGRTFFSNQRRFGQISAAGADWAEQITAAYPPGSAVPVAYSPENPQMAVLEPGVSSEAWWLPGAAAVSFLFGIGAIWLVRRGEF